MDKDLRLKEVDFGIDSSRRVIYLNDEITLSTPTFLMDRINLIVDLSEDDKSPISVFLSSNGGDIYGMFGTMDVIKSVDIPINVYAFGTATSAAGMILISTTGLRVLTPQSYVMLHTVQVEFSGSAPAISNEAGHTDDIHHRFVTICTECSNKDEEFWDATLRTESYFNAEECLELGLIDKIHNGKQT